MHRQTYGLTIITDLAVSSLDLGVTLERYAFLSYVLYGEGLTIWGGAHFYTP